MKRSRRSMRIAAATILFLAGCNAIAGLEGEYVLDPEAGAEGGAGGADCSDDGDCPEAPCFVGHCSDAACAYVPAPMGAQCNGNGYCYNAECVTCEDKVLNGAETGVDCGGPACPPCYLGEACSLPSDCYTGLCVDGVCCDSACAEVCVSCALPGKQGQCGQVPAGDPDSPACVDGGCGPGGNCGVKVPNGGSCGSDDQCASGHCSSGVCKKGPGVSCYQNEECESASCVNNLCT
jgi:hypothetical protein